MEHLTVPGTLESLEPIGKFVLAAAASAALDRMAAYRLRLAVDEIATNAIVHGYQEAGREGSIEVRSEVRADALSITLEDTGELFDPRLAPPPPDIDAPLEQRRIGGLGVYLAVRGVDQFSFERVGNVNRNVFVMQRVDEVRLAHDLIHVILPIGVALSGEVDFDRLLERILSQAKAVCRADGGTLYLREADELRFAIMFTDSLKIAAGGTSGTPITLPPLPLRNLETGAPNMANVATHAAILGQSVNIPDTYAATKFDFSGTRAFDERNGYRSISTLTVPLKSHDRQVIGVLQLLNAKDPKSGQVVAFDSYLQQLVEALASQAAVVLNNRILLEGQKELVRFEKELQIGQQIQESFLPDHLPEIAGWQLAAEFHPAREVAGDFYDTFQLPGSRHLGFVIADVCDKGVGAALFMALVRSLMRAFSELRVRGAEGVADPVELTNRYILVNHSQTTMFATLFFGVLDPSTGVVRYVNAGHNAPYIVGPRGVKTRLKPSGPAVGMFADATFAVQQVSLEPEETLFGFTDGVTEARDSSAAFFTEKRLQLLLQQPAPSAKALLERVSIAVRAHIATAPQFDDITMIVLRRQ